MCPKRSPLYQKSGLAEPLVGPRQSLGETSRHPEDTDLNEYDVVIVGAGVIGASIAYHLAREDSRVAIFDGADAPCAPSASWASGGGLRSQRRDPREWPLAIASASRWPTLSEELGFETDFRPVGHLHLAERDADVSQLRAGIERERAAGIEVGYVDGSALLKIAPALAPSILAAAYTAGDGQADPRLTTHAFVQAAERHGATIVRQYVERIGLDNGAVNGVVVDGARYAAGTTILAAGSWSMRLATAIGLTLPIKVRAYQMLLSMPRPHVLGPTITAVDRVLLLKQLQSGAFLIGGGWPGTIDHDAHTCSTTPASIEGNWSIATQVVPAVASSSIASSWCGLEGDAFDGVPLIGPVANYPGLYLAVGFSGHGFQLAPAVGEAVARAVRSGSEPPALSELGPARIEAL